MDLADYLLKFVGTPYLWGGNNVSVGVDCSGLVNEGIKAMGWFRSYSKKDRNSKGLWLELYHDARWMEVRLDDIIKDDVLFWGHGHENMNHVSVALSRNLMVESGGGDSSTKFIWQARKKNAMVRVRPIDERKHFLVAYRYIGEE